MQPKISLAGNKCLFVCHENDVYVYSTDYGNPKNNKSHVAEYIALYLYNLLYPGEFTKSSDDNYDFDRNNGLKYEIKACDENNRKIINIIEYHYITCKLVKDKNEGSFWDISKFKEFEIDILSIISFNMELINGFWRGYINLPLEYHKDDIEYHPDPDNDKHVKLILSHK